jgi:hypothetical protein
MLREILSLTYGSSTSRKLALGLAPLGLGNGLRANSCTHKSMQLSNFFDRIIN